MHIIYIGIGSNLGDRQENCLEAVRRLEMTGVKVTRQSSLLETEPWGFADQPNFINMAVEACTDIPPKDLLVLLKSVEREMGRQQTVQWGPRVIDLDLLFYDDLVLESAELNIPHPRLHERDFVLRPLSEIAPGKEHPVLKKTVLELLRNRS